MFRILSILTTFIVTTLFQVTTISHLSNYCPKTKQSVKEEERERMAQAAEGRNNGMGWREISR